MSKPIVVLTSNTSWYLYNFRKNTISALLHAGCDVFCLAPPDRFSAQLETLGARFVALDFDAAGTNLFKELQLFLRIFFLLRKLKPDYVFNFTIKMNLYFGLAGRLQFIPFANNVSGLGTAFLHHTLLYRLAYFLYGFANRGARRIFFQNPEDMELFIHKKLVPADRLTLLSGSGVDLKRFRFADLPSSPPFVFTMIARLIADKGVREFVQAARRVKQSHPHCRFVLVGPCSVINKSAITERELQLWHDEGVVELAGEQADVFPWLLRTHVLVLPSHREGMPRTVLEAAAVGRPAIVTDVAGCRHAIVPGETGWLCEVRNPLSLAETMVSVLALPARELEEFSRRARLRAEQEFAEERVIQAYLDCIAAVENGKARRLARDMEERGS